MFSLLRLIAYAAVVATSADLLLHPVRLRIMQAFLGDRALTTSQLSAELADIPPASLYRHVARLVGADVLQVVAERRIRGAVERTYVLRAAAARVRLDEIAKMTVEDHRQMFMAFTAGVVADFDRYLARPDADLLRDGVAFGIEAIWVDDAEYGEMMREVYTALQLRRANAPRPGRKRRLIASVLLPADEAAPEQVPGQGRGKTPPAPDEEQRA
jgi:hypothetical protein